MDSTSSVIRQVPQSVLGKLRAVRRAERRVQLITGTLKIIAFLLGLLALAMMIDALFVLFAPAARWGVTATTFVLAAVSLLIWGIFPLLKRLQLRALARSVDAAVPDLQERWSTVTGLTQSKDAAVMLGSPELIAQVCEEAEDLAPRVEAQKVVSRRHLKKALVAFGVMCALGAILFLADSQRAMVLLQRFLAPGSNISLAKITADRGDFFTPVDEPVTLTATVSGRVSEEATLWIEETGGLVEEIPLKVVSETGVVSHAMPIARRDFRYRFRAGDGQTEWHQVRVLSRPRLTGISMKIVPPEYTQLPTVVQETLPRQSSAIAGSAFELVFQSDRPLTKAQLTFHHGASVPAEATDQGRRFATTLEETIHFEIQIVDRHGLENKNQPRASIHVYEDLPPELEFTDTGADENQIYDGSEIVKVPFEAKDDFGIQKAELLVSVTAPGEEPQLVQSIPIDLGDQENATEVQAEGEIDLASLNLSGDSQVSYTVRVTDNRQTDAAISSVAGVPMEANAAQGGTQPPQGGAQQPPQGGAQQPPQGGAQQPPQGGAQQPPQGGAQQPPQGGAQQPPQGGAQQPPQGGAQQPPQGSSTGRRSGTRACSAPTTSPSSGSRRRRCPPWRP